MRSIRPNIILWVSLGWITGCQKTETPPAPPSPPAQYAAPTSASQKHQTAANPVHTYKTYSGAWFKIEYPAGFHAEGSQKSSTSDRGFDSATFTSPDGKVQFYVYSPQWSGEAEDIQLESTELQINTEHEVKGNLTLDWWTITEKDKKYLRSYEKTTDNAQNTVKIFGIQYASEADRQRYLDDYLHFKKSLVQYAD